MADFQYSVVVPVYNSEKTLVELYQRTENVFSELNASFQMILVDDGSRDNSWQVIQQLKEQYMGMVVGVRLASNFGQHSAILCGLNFVADGSTVITIDDDLQTPPEEIKTLIEAYKAGGHELVYGVYPVKKHSWLRNLGSFLMERVFHYFASTPGRGSSFKLIDFEIVKKVRVQNQRYVYIDEMLCWFTSKIEFIPVKHESRKDSSSGYTFWKLVRMTINLIMNYTVFPLRLMTYFGLLAAMVCLGISIYFIYLKVEYGAALGFTALIVAIFFSASVIMFCLGILGEYINRLYTNQNNRPPYFIDKVL